MKIFQCLFISIIVLSGCYKEESQVTESLQGLTNVVEISKQKPKSILDFTFEKTYGKSKDIIISYLSDFEITNDGRILIADFSAKTIHIFSDSNRYLGSFGNGGLGPGEFQGITDIKATEDKLYVFDRSRFMIHIFDLRTYSYLHSEKVRQYPRNDDKYKEIEGWIPTDYNPLYNGKALSGFMKHPRDARPDRETYNIGKKRLIKYYLLDYDGKILEDKFFELRDYEDLSVRLKGKLHTNTKPQTYLGQPILVFGNSGNIYMAWSKDFLIKQYGTDGSYVRSFHYQGFPKRKLNREELKKIVPKRTWNRPLIEQAELPEYWPALYTIEIDDEGRVWVATIHEGTSSLQWWVISENGKLIGRGEMTREDPLNWFRKSKPIVEIKKDYLYVAEQDTLSGVSLISKYKFNFR